MKSIMVSVPIINVHSQHCVQYLKL